MGKCDGENHGQDGQYDTYRLQDNCTIQKICAGVREFRRKNGRSHRVLLDNSESRRSRDPIGTKIEKQNYE